LGVAVDTGAHIEKADETNAGLVVVYPAVAHFALWFTELNGWFGAGPARCVANAHTFFNLINVLTVLPFSPQVAQLIERAFPEQAKKGDGILQHITEEQMEYHPMAIESAELEVKRVAFLARKLMRSMGPALQTEDSAELWKLKEADDEIDIAAHEAEWCDTDTRMRP
jgi:Na+/phosphate symporter